MVCIVIDFHHLKFKVCRHTKLEQMRAYIINLVYSKNGIQRWRMGLVRLYEVKGLYSFCTLRIFTFPLNMKILCCPIIHFLICIQNLLHIKNTKCLLNCSIDLHANLCQTALFLKLYCKVPNCRMETVQQYKMMYWTETFSHSFSM